MTDLNTGIAVSKGWMFHHKDDCLPPVYFREIGNNGKIEIQTLPDYEHDVTLYMALFEEMPDPEIHKNDADWIVIADLQRRPGNYILCKSDTIGTAICLAFCKWKGIEVVG